MCLLQLILESYPRHSDTYLLLIPVSLSEFHLFPFCIVLVDVSFLYVLLEEIDF